MSRDDREKVEEVLSNITEEDIENEVNKLLKNPNKATMEVKNIIGNLSQQQVSQGIKQYGGEDQFIQAILYYLGFHSLLIRKGVKVGVAAAVGSAVFFGTGSLGHTIAGALGSASIDSIADGFDLLGDLTSGVSDTALGIAESSMDSLTDLCDIAIGLLGLL